MKSGVQDRSLYAGIQGWIKHKLNVFAELLQKQVSQLSFAGQKRILVLYCIIAMGISTSVSYWSLAGSSRIDVKVTPIHIVPFRSPVMKAPIITEGEFHRIHKWRLHLDSLYGPSHLESLLPADRQSWTLRDTLLYLEQLYQQHK